MRKYLYSLALLPWLIAPAMAVTEADADLDPDAFEFSDRPLEDPLHRPDWFKIGFLNLREDLDEAVSDGREGIIIYFGQKHCAYCKALLEVNWGKPDIVSYTRAHFDVIGIDIWGDREVTDMDGNSLTEKTYSEREKTNFTPSLLFYDRHGDEALLLRGYYPPYRFRAALEYVADGHYQSKTFAEFLALAPTTLAFEADDLIEEDFFERPPYILDRSRFPADQPLAVFFEQGDCYACDVLHTGPLHDDRIREQLKGFQTVQLDIWSDKPIVTPDGKRITARQWAHDLGLFYTPSILFFDQRGNEIIRVDSVVRFRRLRGVLNYVASGAYQRYPTFQRWRQAQGLNPPAAGSASGG